MQKVLTAEQMREVDRQTIEKYGIASLLLMESAAQAAARTIIDMLGGSAVGRSILVLCGKGNNGGDGAAVARILSLAGASAELVLFGKKDETKGDARINFDAASVIVHDFREIESGEEWEEWLTQKGDNWDVVVDAIFGTGLNRAIDPWLANIVRHINGLNGAQHNPPRLALSIDIPSGLNSDTSAPLGEVFQADITVTFTAPKPANILAPASGFNGELVVADIGSPHELLDSAASQLYLAGRDDVTGWLVDSKFTDSSYKNKRGHALIVAGSRNYSGAAVLCGDAAIRSGIGLVTLAVPDGSRESVVARVSPEVMVRSISETPNGSASERAADEVAEFLDNVDVIAVGSGLSSKEDETRRFVRRLIEERSTPVVIDADGLTALSPFDLTGNSELPLILTPHEGEFLRLLRTEDKAAIKDRIAAVRDFAQKHNVILVLKGERVLVGDPGGNVVVNPTGNSGLGKAGNGDTLTGLITGFVAQAIQIKIDIFETVVAAVYIAGLAGDIAEQKYGKRVMTASDVRDCLAEVFAELDPGSN